MFKQFIVESIFLLGAVVMFTAVVGVFRFPDFFSRLHASGLADSFALPLAFCAYSIAEFPDFVVLKAFFCLLVIWFFTPLSCYLLFRSAV